MSIPYKSVLYDLPDPVIICNNMGLISFANHVANEVFGELEGLSIFKIIPAFTKLEASEQGFANNKEAIFETRIKQRKVRLNWKIHLLEQDDQQRFILLMPIIPIQFSNRNTDNDNEIFNAGFALSASEKETLLKQLYSQAPIGITIINSATKRFADSNPMMSKILGYSKAELQQLTYLDITPKHYHQLDRIQTEALYISGHFGPYEKEYFHKDGHTVTVVLYGDSFFKENGERMVWLYIQDISRQKVQEKRLNDSLNSVKILFDQAPEAYLLTDIKGRLVDANSAAERLFRLNKSDYIGKNLLHLKQLPLSEIPKIASVLAQHAMGKSSKPYELLVQKDEIRMLILQVQTYNVRISEKQRLLTIAHEVTDQKKYERQIINEKYKAQQYLDIAGSVIIGIKPDHTISLINQAGCKLAEFEKPEMIGQAWFKFLKNCKETNEIEEFLDKCFLDKNVPDKTLETKLVVLSGKTYYYIWKNNLIYNENGQIEILLFSGIDITEQKRIQLLLEEKESRSAHLNLLSQLALQPVTDSQHWIQLAEIFRQLMRADECYITAWDEKKNTAIPVASHATMFDLFTKLEPLENENTFTQDVLQNNSPLVIQDPKLNYTRRLTGFNQFKSKTLLGIPMIVEDQKLGAILVGYTRKQYFTPEKTKWGTFAANYLALAFHKTKLIQELLKSNAAKDRLFSVISHDLKSPMAGLINLTEILLKDLPVSNVEEHKNMMQTLYETVVGLDLLIDQMLNWNRLERGMFPLNAETINMNDLLSEICKQLKTEAAIKNINIIAEIPENIQLQADPRMIQSVLRNICHNAIKFSYPDQEITVKVVRDADYIKINIEDRGVGMTPETVQNLFQLDSSKSETGTSGEKGTGLGLLIVNEFVKLHRGTIHVESEPGKGSVFVVSLPQPLQTSLHEA
ncbi:MAG: PAS domain S-box protein [Bacteroidales bacterium]|nr:PAS domain S-box protein [Bacteroidales bacterium]HOI31825.1 PAS domain S-box protein [Bacteroidales bacterium]